MLPNHFMSSVDIWGLCFVGMYNHYLGSLLGYTQTEIARENPILDKGLWSMALAVRLKSRWSVHLKMEGKYWPLAADDLPKSCHVEPTLKVNWPRSYHGDDTVDTWLCLSLGKSPPKEERESLAPNARPCVLAQWCCRYLEIWAFVFLCLQQEPCHWVRGTRHNSLPKKFCVAHMADSWSLLQHGWMLISTSSMIPSPVCINDLSSCIHVFMNVQIGYPPWVRLWSALILDLEFNKPVRLSQSQSVFIALPNEH